MNVPSRNPWFSDKVDNLVKTNNDLSISKSGNSDVDVNVNVNVDTRPIAYALLISLNKQKKISREEFEEAIRELDDLIEKSERRNNQRKSWFSL